jgi:hypothetical protein
VLHWPHCFSGVPQAVPGIAGVFHLPERVEVPLQSLAEPLPAGQRTIPARTACRVSKSRFRDSTSTFNRTNKPSPGTAWKVRVPGGVRVERMCAQKLPRLAPSHLTRRCFVAGTITSREEISRAGHRLSQRSLVNKTSTAWVAGFTDKMPRRI